MMEWFTKHLLNNKINELNLKVNKDEMDECIKLQYEKELLVLERLKIEGIDLCGDIDIVRERLGNNSIYFCDKQKYNEMEQKAELYDEIRKIII